MKTAQYEAKKSIFSKLINALRNSILSDILVSEEAGQVITPDELDLTNLLVILIQVNKICGIMNDNLMKL